MDDKVMIQEKEPAISIVMPCYNVEAYIEEAVNSVLKQTFCNYELICLDDGSTDNTLQMLKKYATEDDRVHVIPNENRRQAYERNEGIRRAKGKYIYFMDADDILKEECLERVFGCLERLELDLLYFEGESIYETKELEEQFPQFKNLYTRKNKYPDVYQGKQLYVEMRKTSGEYIVMPCMQMVRADFLRKSGIFFPEMKMLEDNIYTLKVLLAAGRVGCIHDKFYIRRVHAHSTMTTTAEDQVRERVYCYVRIVNELLGLLDRYEGEKEVYDTLLNHVISYIKQLQESKKDYPDIQVSYTQEMMTNATAKHVVPLLLAYQQKHDALIESKRKRDKELFAEKSELNARLQRTYQEKSEINAKLQRTYQEKSEINAKLQKTYQEKSEINAKLQKTYQEKSEINAKLQKTYKEKSEINARLKEANVEVAELNARLQQVDQEKEKLNEELQKIMKKKEFRH